MASEQRCKTCRWWSDSEDDLPGEKRWGTCWIAFSERCAPKYEQTLAYALSTSKFGNLTAREDFGCVQWEPKPQD